MMRVLLVLPEEAQRQACAEYFSLRGCDVDAAGERDLAQSLLRCRTYDTVVFDGDIEHPASLLALADRRNAAVFPVILSTFEGQAHPTSIMTLTKVLRLGTLLEIARGEVRRRQSSQPQATPCN